MTKIDTGSATSTTGSHAARVTNSTGSEIAERQASGACSRPWAPCAQVSNGRAFGTTLRAPTASDSATHAHENSPMRTNCATVTRSYSVSSPSVATVIVSADSTSKTA